MSRVIVAVPVVILCALLAVAGCTVPFLGQQPGQDVPPAVNVGLNSLDTSDDIPRVTLNTALTGLREELIEGGLAPNGTADIRYIQGRDLDASGKASRWSVALNFTSGSILMILDGGQWTQQPWAGRLPDQQIDTQDLVSPEDLFVKNHDRIYPAGTAAVAENSELDLRDSLYSLEISQGGRTRYLSFSARTGEPVA